jgi:hypothetical protein
MPLDQWNDGLDGHFRSLVRKRAGSGFPIFSLEHDLNPDEIQEIFSLLRSRLKARLPLRTHWLLWVIYATECGYDYVGDEYWKSFEERTPGWQFSDRYKVVPWFRKFQSSYNGVVPSGPWAAHFKIIAWPITHAILPRYLQRQFARVLYDLRFRLAIYRRLNPPQSGGCCRQTPTMPRLVSGSFSSKRNLWDASCLGSSARPQPRARNRFTRQRSAGLLQTSRRSEVREIG